MRLKQIKYIKNMVQNLSEIEEEIFKQEVNRVGVKAITDQLSTAKPRESISDEDFFGYVDYTCLTVKLQFYTTQITDPLHQLIMDRIAKIEEKNGYIPEQLTTQDKDVGMIITMQTNFLGQYTSYYHKTDENGPYIECICNFTQKQVLEKILRELKLTGCIGQNRINYGKWYSPNGKKPSECTYCDWCVKNGCVNVSDLYKINKVEQCNCDCPQQKNHPCLQLYICDQCDINFKIAEYGQCEMCSRFIMSGGCYKFDSYKSVCVRCVYSLHPDIFNVCTLCKK